MDKEEEKFEYYRHKIASGTSGRSLFESESERMRYYRWKKKKYKFDIPLSSSHYLQGGIDVEDIKKKIREDTAPILPMNGARNIDDLEQRLIDAAVTYCTESPQWAKFSLDLLKLLKYSASSGSRSALEDYKKVFEAMNG